MYIIMNVPDGTYQLNVSARYFDVLDEERHEATARFGPDDVEGMKSDFEDYVNSNAFIAYNDTFLLTRKCFDTDEEYEDYKRRKEINEVKR